MHKHIVRIWGGLGNQMFQYAFYMTLLSKRKNAFVDLSWYETHDSHNGYELENVFALKPRIADPSDCSRLGNTKYDLFHRAINKFFPKKTFIVESGVESIKYNRSLLDITEGYYAGYWQSAKYFETIQNKIREAFTFSKHKMPKEYDDCLDKVQNTESVSMHIRRGDYVNNPMYTDICNDAYYERAVSIIREHKPNTKLFIFSNDPEWCREKWGNNCIVVDAFHGENSYMDMALMSQCKHNIIANSSFSWWGAWLNTNPHKLVVAPKKWFNLDGADDNDIVLEDWIKI